MQLFFHGLPRGGWIKIFCIIGLISLFLVGCYYLRLWLSSLASWRSHPATSLTLAPSLQPERRLPQFTAPATPAITTILFTGDLMFDRDIRTAAQRHGNDFIFAPIREMLLNYDLVVANLEGPITDHPSRSQGSVIGSPANYSFTFDPSLADTLYRHNIRVVNLGNNHILNFGLAGLDQTLTRLTQANVAAFGYTGVTSTTPLLTVSHVIEHNHQRIAFINYNQFTPGLGSQTTALSEITRLRPQVDWIVIYTHWGNEYQPTAAASTVQLAHQFIDAGADLIIGSHPHVIQNHEIYRDKHIYYSLGNFVFDQYFEPEVKKGLLVGVTFKLNPAELAVTETPIFLLPNGQTSFQSMLPR